jgi:hypothetical protein
VDREGALALVPEPEGSGETQREGEAPRARHG